MNETETTASNGSFKDFGFDANLMEGLEAMGFNKPTPVQTMAIPEIMNNRDLIACAQTGTGKTAAFVLPVLNEICTSPPNNKVNTVIIAPTRELAVQIDQQIEAFSYFTNASSLAVYGGGSGSDFEVQKQALLKGADIVVCTPGRLKAHMVSGQIDFSGVKHLILDEADRMLDMGFFHDITYIAGKLPEKRQTLMFSATMPKEIRDLSKTLLHNPASINIAISKPAKGIKQSAYLVHDTQKIALVKHILSSEPREYVLIFSSTKQNVKNITRTLKKSGIDASEIHSDLDQAQREEVLRDFKNGKVKVLVATDILSRGIDIEGIELVINFDVPHDAEDYVHRIGRTARADKKGEAITFINGQQVRNFQKIEKLMEMEVSKIPLPEGFEKGPEYTASHHRPGRGRRKGYRGSGKKNKRYNPRHKK